MLHTVSPLQNNLNETPYGNYLGDVFTGTAGMTPMLEFIVIFALKASSSRVEKWATRPHDDCVMRVESTMLGLFYLAPGHTQLVSW